MTVGPRRGGRRWAGPLGLAVLAYLPALATAPGVVAADTKQYLALDPGRLLATAAAQWDPAQFGGHVTHQQVGYLWPMGPWFLAGHALGLPVWVVQRLWLGTLFVAAGWGMRWLARHLGLGAPAALAAGAAYQLSPYLLSYVNRTSGLLVPWAGLPALAVCTMLAVRRPGWRWPAVAGLVAGTMGGLNATAVVLVALGPALWLLWAWRHGPWPRRAVGAAAARLALCGAGTACWWATALAVESRYGADVLAYSETVRAVATTASASEGLRGLGYWLFYGGGVDGPWNSAAGPYLTNPLLQALGLGLAAAGLAGLVLARWAPRRWLAVQALVGMALATVAFPPSHASPLGRLLLGAPQRATLVLALRSATRALPLVVLALAAGIGVLVELAASHLPVRWRWAPCAAAVALLAANLPALWTGDLVDASLRRPAAVPSWWRDAAASLSGGVGRALELPGQEFAAYRWGITTDPLLPGLTTRPVLTRDLLPLGSADTMDLLWALDDRAQQGRLEPASVAPVARLLGAGDVVARLDADDARYRTPRPTDVLAALTAAPGLGPLRPYGPVTVAAAMPARVDGRALADPAGPTPAVAVLPVAAAQAPTRLAPVAATVVLAGNGDGVVDAAAAGLIDGARPVRYAADLAPGEALPADAPVIVTDTNRRRARQWRGTQDTVGFTEDGGVATYPADDADARLPVFPDAGADEQTLARQTGGRVTASAYGEPNAYRPEDRAVLAADGDLTTAWRVADRADPVGARWRIDLPAARAVPSVRLVQQQRPANRAVAAVVVRSAHRTVRVDLTDASRGATGQTVALDDPSSSWVEVEIAATTTGATPSWFGLDAVGFAEIDTGTHVDEVVTTPGAVVDRLAAADGAGAAAHPFAVVLTRDRVDPTERWRSDPEPALVRSFRLPTSVPATFTLTARLHQRADDAVLAALLGPAGGPSVRTSSRLAGDAAAAGAAALDGDAATGWTSAVDDAEGAWWEVTLAAPTALGRVTATVVADARHSTPRTLVVTADDQPPRRVAVPADGRVTFDLGPAPVSRLRLTAADVAVAGGVDRRYGETVALPVGLADVTLPGVAPVVRPTTLESGCRTDLVTLDGRPLPVRLTAATAALVGGAATPLALCGVPPALAAGAHELRTAAGERTGIDVDRVVVAQGDVTRAAVLSVPVPSSVAASGPVAAEAAGSAGPTDGLVVRHQGRTDAVLDVPATAESMWLVWGEGRNAGWHATVDGHDLGPATGLVGGGNVWRLEPSATPRTVRLVWAPQRWVDGGLAVSGAAAAACLVLALWPRRRRDTARAPVVPWPTPWSGPWCPPGPFAAAALAVTLGLVAHPLYGAGLFACWCWWRRSAAVDGAGRPPRPGRASGAGAALAVGAFGPALAVAVAGYVVARQLVSRPVAGFGWPDALASAHRPALAAVALVTMHALGTAPASTTDQADDHVGGGQRQQGHERQVEPCVAEEGPDDHEQAGGGGRHGPPPGRG